MASSIRQKKFWHAGWLYDPKKIENKKYDDQQEQL